MKRPDHWSEDIEVEEGVWRDYYTGERLLANFTYPWYGDHEERYQVVLFWGPIKRFPMSGMARKVTASPTTATSPQTPLGLSGSARDQISNAHASIKESLSSASKACARTPH